MKHIKNFRRYYNIGEQDIFLCQVCGAVAVDIHHIVSRKQLGTDEVDNLIALCRLCHMKAHKQATPHLTKDELLACISV